VCVHEIGQLAPQLLDAWGVSEVHCGPTLVVRRLSGTQRGVSSGSSSVSSPYERVGRPRTAAG
jgi:hypothetical protein